MTRPSMVFIPGIWVDGSAFSKVIPRFRRRAHGGAAHVRGGVTFSATCVAAAAQIDEIDVEDVCEQLCRRYLMLRSTGSQMLAGGAVSSR